jgi:hypothetical protein
MLFITENEVMEWVILNRLARSSRPGYPCTDIGTATVDPWMADIRRNGIVAILCLLAEDQLAYYQSIPGGLLSYYRKAGFCVGILAFKTIRSRPSPRLIFRRYGMHIKALTSRFSSIAAPARTGQDVL